MDLEDKLYNVNEILLVESLPFNLELAKQQIAKAEKELSDIYEKPIVVGLINYNHIENGVLANRNNSLIIFNSQSYEEDSLFAIKCVAKVKGLCERLKVESPNSDYLILSNLGNVENGPLRKVLEMILKVSDHEEDNLIDHFTGDRLKMDTNTLLEYLDSKVGQIRHSIGGKKDSEFLKELSERYTEGNCQTNIDKTFLVVSNRLEGLRGKFEVINQATDFSSIDFGKYAAVFVDNNYSFKDRLEKSKLGTGIKVVEKLAGLEVKLPIIYQTAHLLKDFTEEDIGRLSKFENVLLMPKNHAFKICKPEQARKDIAVNEIIASDSLLSKYCVHVYPIREKGYIEHKDIAILATDAVQNVPDTKLLTDRLSLKNNVYIHRLAVLAAFHTHMKSELDNPVFTNTIDYLRPWNIIEEGLENSGFKIEDVEDTRELYSNLRQQHLTETPTTIMHNDPKWDNWFKEYVLGDFSDCAPGTEYKDIARALFDKETNFSLVCDNSWVDSNILSYVSARKQLDSEFEPLEDFGTKVKELIFMESLRLARFKAQNKDNIGIVNGLLSVARHYQEVLCDSYRTMPKIGDNAPYNSLAISI